MKKLLLSLLVFGITSYAAAGTSYLCVKDLKDSCTLNNPGNCPTSVGHSNYIEMTKAKLGKDVGKKAADRRSQCISYYSTSDVHVIKTTDLNDTTKYKYDSTNEFE